MLKYLKIKNNLVHKTALKNWKKIKIGKGNVFGCSKQTKGALQEYASPSLLNREFANQEVLNIDLNI